jgi:N-methylhydantoinase A
VVDRHIGVRPALSVGIDVGGTFTDTVVRGEGVTGVGKTLTRPDDLVGGILESVGAAAASLGTTVDDLLRRATTIAHGTTVGLNALLTRSGAKVGLLTTAGFESTLHIAKANKIIGLDDEDIQDPARWAKPAVFLSRRQIVGVEERTGPAGEELRPLDVDQARAAIRRLGDLGCESVAICLLWSCANPEHELALERLVIEELPGLPLSVSSKLAPGSPFVHSIDLGPRLTPPVLNPMT